ncbi:MAG: hypothetical protein AB1714_25565 [Acidobacteriota bacterium]
MNSRPALLLPASLLLLSPSAFALSPPQYGLGREIEYSFGANPCVDVSDVKEIDESHYEIDVRGCKDDVATALAAILVTDYDFGGIQVKINVLDSDGNEVQDPFADRKAAGIHEIRSYFEAALKGNCFFSRTRRGERFLLDAGLWVEFKKKIIQFWNDDIGDFYGNSTYGARDVFGSLVKTTFETNSGPITVAFTTVRTSNCK